MAQAVTATTPAQLEETGAALLEVDGRHVGEVLSISEDKLLHKQWVGVQFARADVTRSAVRLLDDGEVWIPGSETTASIPLCKLGALGQIGPDVRDVRDGFEPTDAITAYPMVEGNDTEKRKRLSVSNRTNIWLRSHSHDRADASSHLVYCGQRQASYSLLNGFG